MDDGHAGEVVRATGLAAAQVSATLALPEPTGLVLDAGGMQCVREAPAACGPRAGAGAPAPQPTEGETP